MLRQLVEKSLLRFDAEKSRYGFHPLLDRYIKELFGAHSEKQRLEAAHARYYLALLDMVIDDQGNERGEVLPSLKLEVENIEKAWRYATDNGWVDELFRSSKSLQNFASLTAQYRFGDVLINYSLDKIPEDAVNLKTVLLANLSALKFWVGHYEEAIGLARSAYGLLEQAKVEPKRLLSITQLIFDVLQSSYSSLGSFEEALNLSRELSTIIYRQAPNTNSSEEFQG
jgi:tetratricopeptide (TPR) repeat protein